MDISAMDPGNLRELFDADVVDSAGVKVGTVEQIFADDSTGAATFITVINESGEQHFVPAHEGRYVEETVSMPYDRQLMMAAPVAHTDEDLSPSSEEEIRRHYGLLQGDSDEPHNGVDTSSEAHQTGHDEDGPDAEQPFNSVDEEPPAQSSKDEADEVPPRVFTPYDFVVPGTVPSATSGAADDDEPEDTDEDETESHDEQLASTEQQDGQADSSVEAAQRAVLGLPAEAQLRKYVVTEMVTVQVPVQVPVRREVVCWQDADGKVHELDTVDAPEPDADQGERSVGEQTEDDGDAPDDSGVSDDSKGEVDYEDRAYVRDAPNWDITINSDGPAKG